MKTELKKDMVEERKKEVESLLEFLENEYRNAKISEKTYLELKEKNTKKLKELDKKILSKGAWATVMFKYQNLDKGSGKFKEPKISIRRYQKINEEFRLKSKFNISSDEQAGLIIDTLERWIGKKPGKSKR